MRSRARRPVRPRARPAFTLCAPMALRVAHEPADIRVGQRVELHVHHRFGETGAQHRIAQVVHVDKAIDVRVSIGGRPGARSSLSVSGPKLVKVRSPPGRSTREHSRKTASGSAHHCSIRLLKTRSVEVSAKASGWHRRTRRRTAAMGGVACPLLAAWRVKDRPRTRGSAGSAAQRTFSRPCTTAEIDDERRLESDMSRREKKLVPNARLDPPPHRSCARPGQRNARPRATTARTRPGLECGCSSRGDRGSRRWRPLAIEKRHYLVPQGRRMRQKRRVSAPAIGSAPGSDEARNSPAAGCVGRSRAGR